MKSLKYSSKILFTLIIITGFLLVSQYTQAQTYNCTKAEIASWEGCEPLVQTVGTISTDKNSAVVNASYSSNGADYNTVEKPVLYIEYGKVSENDFSNLSDMTGLTKGSETVGFTLKGLDAGEWYQYRAALSWVGGVKYGEIRQFQAIKKITIPTPEPVSSVTVSNTVTDSTNTKNITDTKNEVSTPTSQATTPSRKDSDTIVDTGVWSIFGTKKNTTTSKEPIFKNIEERSGFKLAIDDERTEVRQGDTVTIKVRYENNNAKSFSDGSVEIYLPDQMLITTTSKGIIDKVGNRVVISLRDFPAGAFGTATVTAQVVKPVGDLDQVITQAGLKVADVILKVADVDEYISGNQNSQLGASAGAMSLLPGKLIGWILLLLVLTGAVILGRRYFKKDY